MVNTTDVVYPPEIAGAQVVEECGAHYKCPTCVVQGAADEVDIGWIRCPMLSGDYICIGCCIDLNHVTRWAPMQAHIYYDDFLAVASRTGRSVSELRRQCLEHQLEIIDAKPPEVAAEYTKVRAHIKALLGHPQQP